MQNLKIAFVQLNIAWQNPLANFLQIESLLATQKPNAQVIVLPEMFTTGFSMNAEQLADNEAETTIEWMQKLAKQYKAAVCGSVIVKQGLAFFNQFLWVDPQSGVQRYNKRHLFQMAGEHNYYSPGSEQLLIHYKNWVFKPQICYDLRFPVWARQQNNELYDVLLYVANWPEVRVGAFTKLLQARAIENLSYVVGVNRTGVDGNGVPYNGQSAAYDFKGDALNELTEIEQVVTVTLSKPKLQDFREKFPAYTDSDSFTIS